MTSIADISQLRSDIRACTACDLRQNAIAPVPWSGPHPARYLFIGMAPGISEDKAGKPFIGSSGNLLRYMMKDAGFPTDVAYANAVSCFPGRVAGGDAKPTKNQLLACRSNLTRQIDIIKPVYLFLVGGTALEAFRPDLALANVHGRPLFYDGTDLDHDIPHAKHGLVVWTIYHPAAALRSKKYERLIVEDLTNFLRWVEMGERWPETCYICDKDVHRYDHWGFATCELHSYKQTSLL